MESSSPIAGRKAGVPGGISFSLSGCCTDLASKRGLTHLVSWIISHDHRVDLVFLGRGECGFSLAAFFS